MHYLEGQPLLIWHARKKRIHLGDAIACAQSGIYVARRYGLKSIKLAVADAYGNVEFVRHMLDYFDCGDLEVSIVPVTGSEEYAVSGEFKKLNVPAEGQLCFYDATYTKSKIPRAAKIQKKICYSWDAIYLKKHAPSNIELMEEALEKEFTGYEFVKLGRPLTIEEDLQQLSDCYFYIGLDSGIAHLCRLMGAPMFLLGKIVAHPPHACQRKILEWKNVNDVWVNKHELLDEIHGYLFDIYKEVC